MCGQGEWRTESKAYKDWTKHATLRAPKTCLNYTTKRSGWLGDRYCALLPGRCTSWTGAQQQDKSWSSRFFSAKTLLDALRRSWLFWVSSSCESKMISCRPRMANWCPLTGKHHWWAVDNLELCVEKDSVAASRFQQKVVCASLPVSSRYLKVGEEGLQKVLTLGVDSRNMKARREP